MDIDMIPETIREIKIKIRICLDTNNRIYEDEQEFESLENAKEYLNTYEWLTNL